MRAESERVTDILGAITRIESRLAVDYERFAADELLQVWAIHHLEIIGEAARHLSAGFCQARPEIPWSEIVRMRDRLVHGYWDLRVRLVWETVKRDLPRLRAALTDPR